MRKKILKKIILVIVLLAISILTINIESNALDTSRYTAIYAGGTEDKLSVIGKDLIGVIQGAGTGIAVIMLVVNAIRFMLAAPEQKAQIKAQLIVFTIGAVLLFGGTTIFSIIARQAQNM